jgi:hypothetical protein
MSTAEAIEDGDEVPAVIADSIASWGRVMRTARDENSRDLLRSAAGDLFRMRRVNRTVWPRSDGIVNQAIVDSLAAWADGAGIDADEAQSIFAAAQRDEPREKSNGHAVQEPPPPTSADDYGISAAAKPEKAPLMLPPLTIGEWLSRDLPAPDFILGDWLSTTSRALLVAPTGLGKTGFALAKALHAAAGKDFLHWRGRRPCKVLYIDGEMARRLFKERIADAAKRLGEQPAGFHALSHEDVEGFAPLNTREGQSYIERLIEQIGNPDLIVFDSIMCLLVGDMKDGEPWAQIMPWVRSLTRRRIGQLWVHHTGHDASRSYGDKTKEWQLDTVMHMEAIDRDDTDVSFSLEFRKARERTPATRADFQTARIALVGDQWTVQAPAGAPPGRVSPLGLKFLTALHNAIGSDGAEQRNGRRSASLDLWRVECGALGLLEIEPGKPLPALARSLFSKHRRELIAANRIASDEARAWLVK